MIISNTVGEAFDQARDELVQPVFESAGSDMVDDMRERIGVMVGYYGSIPLRVVGQETRPDKSHTSLEQFHRVLQRSEGGEPPRRETGNLYNSIEYFVSAYDPLVLTVFTDVEYSKYLELGEFRGGAPRPHWVPLFETWSDLLPDRVQAAVR